MKLMQKVKHISVQNISTTLPIKEGQTMTFAC